MYLRGHATFASYYVKYKENSYYLKFDNFYNFYFNKLIILSCIIFI